MKGLDQQIGPNCLTTNSATDTDELSKDGETINAECQHSRRDMALHHRSEFKNLVRAQAVQESSEVTPTKVISEAIFEEAVLNADRPVLVNFWAEWCGPCHLAAPAFEELAAEMRDFVDFVRINVDENPHAPSRYGVRSIPTLMLFKSGKVVATKIGTLPPARLQSWLNERLLQNASAVMRGKVKWFDAKKGYGFITPDRNSKDIFVHIAEVQMAGLSGLEEGAVVEFELDVGKNGHEAAINIKKFA